MQANLIEISTASAGRINSEIESHKMSLVHNNINNEVNLSKGQL